jgi:hypothetical protein
MVMENIRQYPELKLIDAQKVYKEKFEGISETIFYKALSRLAKNGEIERITKGIYCKPKKGRFGITISNEKDILEYFLGKNKNKGVVIGYRLFNKYKLTTQVSKIIELYSSVIIQEKRNIRNVAIKKANLRFNITTIRMIELLEILQEYKNIEDLNMNSFIKFIEETIKYYDEKTVERIIKSIGYKKGTLASLRNILEFFNLENTIDKYLNGISKYNAINMGVLYETTL